MKSWVFMSGLLVGAFFLQAVPTSATASQAKVVVKAQSQSDLQAVEVAVHEEMASGKRYEYVTRRDRDIVDSNFATMQSLFAKYGSVEKMRDPDRIQLFNAQESINSILNHNDSSRLVCKSEAPLGSNIPKTMCRTYGQIEESRRNTEQFEQHVQQVQAIVGAKN